jgi:hypothetical protein
MWTFYQSQMDSGRSAALESASDNARTAVKYQNMINELQTYADRITTPGIRRRADRMVTINHDMFEQWKTWVTQSRARSSEPATPASSDKQFGNQFDTNARKLKLVHAELRLPARTNPTGRPHRRPEIGWCLHQGVGGVRDVQIGRHRLHRVGIARIDEREVATPALQRPPCDVDRGACQDESGEDACDSKDLHPSCLPACEPLGRQRPRSNGLAADDLAGFDARCADVDAVLVAARTVGDAHALNVGIPSTAGPAMRVRHRLAEAGGLPTDIADGSHT